SRCGHRNTRSSRAQLAFLYRQDSGARVEQFAFEERTGSDQNGRPPEIIQMRSVAHGKAAWAIAGWLAMAALPTNVQSQRKPPPKPSTTRETEDPLAPLLQQAKDAMDKMDFAAALEPLQ